MTFAPRIKFRIIKRSAYLFQGAQEVFQHLPHEYVTPNMLQKIAKHGDLNKVYACEVISQWNSCKQI